MNFSISEYKPSGQLERFVDRYWKGTFNLSARQDTYFKMIPNGCLEMIIHLDDIRCRLPQTEKWMPTPEYMLIGLITSTQQVRFTSTVPVFTIRFKPEALFELFHISGGEVINRFEDMDLLTDIRFRNFCHRIREADHVNKMVSLSEQFLKTIASRRKSHSDYVNKAAELMRHSDTISIREISDKVNISQRQLERKFKEVMGIRPKEYLRLTRINKVMRLLEQRSYDLTSVAYHCGYFDQAHFINDFKRITGINPKVYHNKRQDFIALPGKVTIDDQ